MKTEAFRMPSALEQTMRDTLDNMEEFVSGYGYHCCSDDLTILSIERPTKDNIHPHHHVNIFRPTLIRMLTTPY
ncbi:MAG: hypothetical protein HQL49_00080 [Gammaproteobacteria bacterium]|nr:hypothetical protein [Gammaproteobacteria bacterium]